MLLMLGMSKDWREVMGKEFNAVRDSGAEQDFGTGAVRDTQVGKGRFDLLPPYALLRLAQHFENGANRYEARNWEKGIPCSRYLDSAFRHMIKMLMGLDDEDHESACAWNILCLVETKLRAELGILPKELNDLPNTYKEYVGHLFPFEKEEGEEE